MRFAKPLVAVAGAVVFLAGCDDQPLGTRHGPDTDAAVANRGAALDPHFAAAASEFWIPADLLKAVSYTETGWAMIAGESSDIPQLGPAWGVMALRGEQLARGARLAGVGEAAVRTQAAANIRAGAALLKAYADELGVANRADAGAWAAAVARFGNLPAE